MEKPGIILAAALKLFVTYGFHGTPTSKIASEAGVSNGTLFHYFKTKDELVVSLYNQIKETMTKHIAPKIAAAEGFQDKFRTLFVNSVQWALENQDAYYFVQQFHFSPHMELVPAKEIEKQAKMHTQLLLDAHQAKILKPLPVDLIGELAGGQINSMYQYLVRNPQPKARQNKLINEAFDLVWSMLTNTATA